MSKQRWRMFKAVKETPCCGQSVRVRRVEPGVQSRRCDLCKQVSSFVLEPMTTSSSVGVLRLRWISDAEEARLIEAEAADLSDLDVTDL